MRSKFQINETNEKSLIAEGRGALLLTSINVTHITHNHARLITKSPPLP